MLSDVEARDYSGVRDLLVRANGHPVTSEKEWGERHQTFKNSRAAESKNIRIEGF